MEACIIEKRKSCSCVQTWELCQIFGLLLPSLTASWLFRWYKNVFFFKVLYQITHLWIIGLTLHSCLTCLLPEMTSISHVFLFRLIQSKCAQNWDCTSKKIWFWCRLQGSQVSERSVLLMDRSNMYVTLHLNWSSSSDPQEMTPLGGVGLTHLLSKYRFCVNSSSIGFSPKKCF